MRNYKWSALLVAGTLLVGCASPEANVKLARFDRDAGYRFKNLSSPDNSDKLLVILTFSGGGTRAAALAYGVAEQLKATTIKVDGETRSLLDEVDVISSVSGGSFTSAYYGLFGERLFEDFEEQVLKRNIQDALIRRVLAPWNWIRLASPTFSQSDLAAEYYDKHLFEGQTYGDLIRRGNRPFVIINAVDMTLGSPFEFTQDQFDVLYSDLASVPVARAVAASSAFPILLSPVAVKNWNCTKQPDFVEPMWVEQALEDGPEVPRRFQDARQARSYSDLAQGRRFIHLIDGGVVDNLGLRPVLRALSTTDSGWSVLRMVNLEKVDRVAIIVVNAETAPDTSWDKSQATPGAIDVAKATVCGLLDTSTFDTATELNGRLYAYRQEEESRKACERLLIEKECKDTTIPGGPMHPVDWHVVEVSFDRIAGDDREAKYRYFRTLPTSLKLPDEAIGCLRQIGSFLLAESRDFKMLVEALDGSVNALVQPAELGACRSH